MATRKAKLPSGAHVALGDTIAVEGEVAWRGSGLIEGWVRDRSQPDRTLWVELLIDGLPVACVAADRYNATRAAAGEVPHQGFAADIPLALWRHGLTLSARLANTQKTIGMPVPLPAFDDAGEDNVPVTAEIVWRGGLTVEGLLPRRGRSLGERITAEHEGRTVAEALLEVAPGYWPRGVQDASPVGFSLHLPPQFADGVRRWITVRDGAGLVLGPARIPVLIHPRPQPPVTLPDVSAPDLHGQLNALSALLPCHVPFGQVRGEHLQAAAAPPVATDVLSLIWGEADEIDLFLGRHADHPHPIVTCAPDHFAAELAATLEAAVTSGDLPGQSICLLARAGTTFEPSGPAHMLAPFIVRDRVCLTFGDTLAIQPDGTLMLKLKPAFDWYRQLTTGYMEGLIGCRLADLRQALTRTPATLLELIAILIAMTEDRDGEIAHVPYLVAKVQSSPHSRADLAAAAQRLLGQRGLSWRVVPNAGGAGISIEPGPRSARPSVAILIPTRDKPELLGPCLATLALTRYRDRELILIDHETTDPVARGLLDAAADAGARLVPVEGPFNFARFNNHAAGSTQAELLVFLNNDVEIREPDWLERMALYFDDPTVGVVGARLLWADGSLQHGGVVLGPHMGATHLETGVPESDPGYLNGLRGPRQVSAVTGACLMIRRQLFVALGGFDADLFAVNFNDVDLCLRAQEQGHRVVWTPITLLHHESATRRLQESPSKNARMQREVAHLRDRWLAVIADDPYFHPHLSFENPIPHGIELFPRSPRNRISRVSRTGQYPGWVHAPKQP